MQETLTKSQIDKAKSWYRVQNFTESYIKEFQREVKTKDDGIVGSDTITKVYSYQVKHNLAKDGEFGNECAAKAGITPKVNKPDNNTTNKPSQPQQLKGKVPLFQKQYNYRVTPYVSKTDYTKMKQATNGLEYSSWDVNSSKINSIYKSATVTNKGKSTIASSGCGITSYANLMGLTPYQTAEMSMKEGCRIYRKGTAGSFFSNRGGAESWSATDILNKVAQGKSAICSMGYGHWCANPDGGHFILIYNYDGNTVYVSDPNSSSSDRVKGTKKQFTSSFKYGYTF